MAAGYADWPPQQAQPLQLPHVPSQAQVQPSGQGPQQQDASFAATLVAPTEATAAKLSAAIEKSIDLIMTNSPSGNARKVVELTKRNT